MLVLTSLGVEAVPRTETMGLCPKWLLFFVKGNVLYKQEHWILEVLSASFVCLFVILVLPKNTQYAYQ